VAGAYIGILGGGSQISNNYGKIAYRVREAGYGSSPSATRLRIVNYLTSSGRKIAGVMLQRLPA